MNIITTNRLGAKRRPLLATATGCSLGLASLLLAACGGGAAANASTTGSAAHAGSGGATTAVHSAKHKSKKKHKSGKSAAASSPQAEALEYAQCMRSHGVPNFPDNGITIISQGGHTNVEFRLPASIGQSPQYQSASEACRKLLPNVGQTGGLSPKVTAELLKFSNCMRSHGVTNFPEPSSTGLMIRAGTGPGEINPNSPQFQAASKACRSLEPAGMNLP